MSSGGKPFHAQTAIPEAQRRYFQLLFIESLMFSSLTDIFQTLEYIRKALYYLNDGEEDYAVMNTQSNTTQLLVLLP